MADGDEEAVDLLPPLPPGLDIPQLDGRDAALAVVQNLVHQGAGQPLDFGVGAGAVEHDPGGSELVAPMDDGDFRAEAGEEVGLLHGGIAAAGDHDLLAPEEEAVASGATADAVSDQLPLAWDSEPAGGGARGDDHGPSLNPPVVDVEAKGAVGEAGFDHRAIHILGAEVFGLLAYVLDQHGAVHALGESGKVLDQRGERELAAGVVPGDDQRLQVRARRVNRGCVSGAARAHDNDVVHR